MITAPKAAIPPVLTSLTKTIGDTAVTTSVPHAIETKVQTTAQKTATDPHTAIVGQPATSSTTKALGTNPMTLRDPIAAHRVQLKADLRIAIESLKKLPPALTFFGGARIQPSDPYYAISQEIGRLLAERGVPPRTGAGPGIMQSVPEGYVQRRNQLEADGKPLGPSEQLRQIDGVGDGASLDDLRTQGFNIKLPHEQKLNAVIECAQEIQLFPFRKLALYENARGVVTFPGGFGTLDELFEIWNLAASGKLTDPLAAVGVAFWQPTMDALQKVAVTDRKLLSPEDFARLFVTDDPKALLDHMLPSAADGLATKMGFEQEPDGLQARLIQEVDTATKGMKTLRPAVAFLGGESLAHDDPALAVVKGLTSQIAGQGIAVRVGDGGTGSQAVVDAAVAAGASHKNVQSIAWTGSSSATVVTPAASFTERIPHKELLLRGAEAFVVLPSGLKGLDEMATVLCQMQTGKMDKRPLILVGSDYWAPILKAWQETMLSPDRKLIAPEDMELFTVVDTVEAARAALTNLR
ncbi:MAG: LOG family protein [Deltaproteobacteria bacterium]|nr:LOG family protein [Deltaproteobacteria bacterium]